MAVYFAVFICLLIPGHLTQYGSCCGNSSTYSESGGNSDVHDSTKCQICLSHGQLHYNVLTFASGEIDCPLDLLHEDHPDDTVFRLIVGLFPRAPPLS